MHQEELNPAKEAAKQAFKAQRQSFVAAAATPSGKASLKKACRRAHGTGSARTPTASETGASVPTIEFLGGFIGPAVTAEGEGPLADICDASRAPVGFSCRSASCGFCRVEVLDGADRLEPPDEDEGALLDELDAPAEHRLACQAVVRAGPGLLRVRWVEDG